MKIKSIRCFHQVDSAWFLYQGPVHESIHELRVTSTEHLLLRIYDQLPASVPTSCNTPCFCVLQLMNRSINT